LKTKPNDLVNANYEILPFPDPDGDGIKRLGIGRGLTKREYFAAMAMQGFLSRPMDENENIVAGAAVIVADALIEELNK
jgi:hypothetical protein